MKAIKPAPGPDGRNARATKKIKVGDAVLAEQAPRPFRRAEARFIDICCLIKHRFAGEVPEPLETRDPFAFLACNALLALSGQLNATTRLAAFFERHEPWRRPFKGWAEKYLQKAKATRLVNDKRAGELLRLTLFEREGLHLYTLSPFDVSRDEFEHHKKAKKRAADAERQRRDRAAKGSVTWTEHVSRKSTQSKEAAAPWKTLSMSRAKFFRLQKAARAVSETEPVALVSAIKIGNETEPVAGVEREVRLNASRDMYKNLGGDAFSLTAKSAALFEHAAFLLSRKGGWSDA